MRRLLFLALALAACRPEPAAEIDAGAPLPRVRVATFNVRRFFDTVCDSGACEVGDYEALPSASAFEARAAQLAEAIAALDADLVALEEIETQACLDALLARLGEVLPHGVLGETGGTATVDVAVLSRTPIESVIGHRDAEVLTRPDGTTTQFSRELLEVRATAPAGAPVVLFAAHFRSKVSDDPGRRLAEAQTAGRIVAARAVASPEAIVVLGGDLNDTPLSAPLLALTQDAGLVRLADDLPVDAQATYVYDGRGQAIDHLLLAPTPAAARLPRTARAWRTPGAEGWGGSDHRALSADLGVAP